MKRLVLAGGGHSHIEVLRRFAGNRLAAEIVLVTPDPHQVYSGMLPGHIAGQYDLDEIRIDVATLCNRARAQLELARIERIDGQHRTVRCSDGTEIIYDLLSLDVGSAPKTTGIPGVPEHVIPLRPLADFADAWMNIRQAARHGGRRRVVIVGAGAAGVEVALAMHHALATGSACRYDFVVMSDAVHIMPDHAPGTRTRFERVLTERGIAVRVNDRVTAVAPGVVHTDCGRPVAADHVIWAAGAAPPAWIGESELARDERGFVLVDEALRSVSHPEIFAAGDVATMRDHPRVKAGVYAVRQGPPLAANLHRALSGRPPVPYRPQRTALALIGTGDGRAVGEYGRISFEGAWVWRWKDYIDRRFVARYR